MDHITNVFPAVLNPPGQPNRTRFGGPVLILTISRPPLLRAAQWDAHTKSDLSDCGNQLSFIFNVRC